MANCSKLRSWLGKDQFVIGMEPDMFSNLHQFNPQALAWTDLSASAGGDIPAERYAVATVTFRGDFYAFGGRNMRGEFLGDLKMLDPARMVWTDLTSVVDGVGPSPRGSTRIAILDDCLYFFGGFDQNGDFFSDLFKLNTSIMAWSNLTDAVSGDVPEGVSGHQFVACGERLYVFGGITKSGYQNSVHQLDPAALRWTDLSPTISGDVPLARQNMGLAVLDGSIYLFGGRSSAGVALSGLYRFDPGPQRWTLLSAISGAVPQARTGCALAASGGALYLYGGYSNEGISTSVPMGDLRRYSPGLRTWTDLSGRSTINDPGGRAYFGIATIGHRIYLFGGFDGYGKVLQDLNYFDLDVLNWTSVSKIMTGDIPENRYYHSMASLQGQIYVLGGWGRSGFLNDLHQVNPSTFVWTKICPFDEASQPQASKGHGLTSAGQELFVFGGFSPSGYLNTLHRITPASGTCWVDLSDAELSPEPRAYHGFNAIGNTLYVFGGWSASAFLGDFYAYDIIAKKWTDMSRLVTGNVPSPRSHFGLASVGQNLYLFGGWSTSGLLNDLFRFDANVLSWAVLTEQISGSAPDSRYGHSLGSAGPFLYVYGGIGLHLIPTPSQIAWPSERTMLSSFLALFDWDQLILSPTRNILPFSLILCSNGFPCSLQVFGSANASLQQVSEGKILCASAVDCETIFLQNVNVNCSGKELDQAFISSIGTRLYILNSTFRNCNVKADGGAIQAINGAYVRIINSHFSNLHSSGYGGALSVVGAVVHVKDTNFSQCSSQMGGAISIVDYQCSRSEPVLSSVIMSNCTFERCTSEQRGGAIFSSSGTTLVNASAFESCSAKISGGSVYASRGGSDVWLTVVSSFFNNSMAFESGGGVLHAQHTNTILSGLRCRHNSALKGGGGVVLWEGHEATFDCGPGAYSVDGSFICEICAAGTYQSGLGMTKESGCRPCIAGTVSMNGASSCTYCEAGKYSSVSGRGSVKCIDCVLGKYQTGVGMGSEDNCTKCAVGTFSSYSGSQTCSICEAGTYSTDIGSSQKCQSVCMPGTFSLTGASACIQCLSGKYSSGQKSLITSCISCQPGTFSGFSGATMCHSCLGGTYSLEAASKCSLCPPGTFSSRNSSTSCTQCGLNQYSNASGSQLCSDCIRGNLSLSSEKDSTLLCSSTRNNSLCKLNNRCFDSSCSSGVVGRLVPGEAYDNNEEMRIIIGNLQASQISLTFTSFMTEPDYDVLQVYSCNDALCLNSSLLSTLSGKLIPPPQISSTGLMQIIWSSEVCCPKPSSACFCDNPSNANTLNGWTATFLLAGASSCLNCTQEGNNCHQKLRSHQHATTQKGNENLKSEVESFLSAGRRRHNMDDHDNIAMRHVHSVIPKKDQETKALPSPACPGTSLKRHVRFSSNDEYLQPSSTLNIEYKKVSQPFQQTGVRSEKRRVLYSDSNSSALRFSMCDDTNYAAYGPCIASTYSFLEVFDVPTVVSPMFPGINYQVGVLKKDAYDQTIITDSSSLVQVFAYETDKNQINRSISVLGVSIVQLVKGVGIFSISIKPSFLEVSFPKSLSVLHGIIQVYFSGLDSEAVLNSIMHSTPTPVTFANGSTVCPEGYILDLEKVIQYDGSRSGTCTFCKPGTYSVSPLKGTLANRDPSCLNCPIGGNCALGGGNVSFVIGDWIISSGLYLLVGCPRGFQLQNKVDGSFSQDNQRCIMCTNNQYILNSSSSEYQCMKCPVGAICNGVSLQGIVSGSIWIPDYTSGTYLLTSCPTGFQFVGSADGIHIEPGLQQCLPCKPQQYILNSKSPLYACQDCPIGAVCDGSSLSGLIKDSVWEADMTNGIYILKSCPPGYEFRNTSPGTTVFTSIYQECRLCSPSFYCLGGDKEALSCPAGTYSFAGSAAAAFCIVPSYVVLTVLMPIAKSEFTSAKQDQFKSAIALACSLSSDHILVVSIVEFSSRRLETTPSITVITRIAADNSSAANNLLQSLKVDDVKNQLNSAGFSAVTVQSIHLDQGAQVQSLDLKPIVSPVVSIGAIILLAIFLAYIWRASTAPASRRLIKAKQGEIANQKDLPSELRKKYEAVEVLGSGSYGVVLEAWQLSNGKRTVRRAVKLVHAKNRQFSEQDFRRLDREASILSRLESPYIVHYLESGKSKRKDVYWFVTELLIGSPLDEVLDQQGPMPEMEAIKLGLDMCMALKSLHTMGVIHRDVKPGNIMMIVSGSRADGSAGQATQRNIKFSNNSGHFQSFMGSMSTSRDGNAQALKSSNSELGSDHKAAPGGTVAADTQSCQNLSNATVTGNLEFGKRRRASITYNNAAVQPGLGQGKYSYKLIDLGTAVAVHDVDDLADSESLRTVTELEFAGTPAYAPPESFCNATAVSYPSDIWSLAASLFHLVSGNLPYEEQSAVGLSVSIAGDLDNPAPDIRDRAPEIIRSSISSTFATVIAKGMEKRIEQRYQSVDEFASDLHGCLVKRGESLYSVFISYRVFSEKYHAMLLYDVLNNTTTPAGHRVIVYLDIKRLVNGVDWEEGFSMGLLNSLVALPLLSAGVIDPLTTLKGSMDDNQDNVAKELIIMQALQASQSDLVGKLEVIFPVIIGKPCEKDDPKYPCTGNFFVDGSSNGIKKLATACSPPTMQVVTKFLKKNKVAVGEESLTVSIASCVKDLLALQGAQLWNHPSLQEEEILEDSEIWQKVLKDPPDPPLDLHQLRMIKAEFRSLVSSIHEVIDRAHAQAAVKRQNRNSIEQKRRELLKKMIERMSAECMMDAFRGWKDSIGEANRQFKSKMRLLPQEDSMDTATIPLFETTGSQRSGIIVSTVPPVVLSHSNHQDLHYGVPSDMPARPPNHQTKQSGVYAKDEDIEVGASLQILHNAGTREYSMVVPQVQTSGYSVPAWPYYYGGGNPGSPLMYQSMSAMNAPAAPYF